MPQVIFDAHQDILWFEQNQQSNKIVQTGIERLINSPIKLVVASVFLDPEETALFSQSQKAQIIEKDIKKYLALINQNKKLCLIKTKKDIEQLFFNDLTGFLLHIEGADFVGSDNLEIIDYFYDLGLRSVGLVWNNKNKLAVPAGVKGSLSILGQELIQKCNQLGVIIDLAHANEQTFFQVIKASARPVSVSHANCFNFCRQHRNLTDHQIKILNDHGGVQGIYFSSKFVSDRGAAINDVIRHIKHSYSLAPHSTMIGSDFGGITAGLVKGLESIDKLPLLMAAIRKEMGIDAVDKIAYQNFLIFLKKIL